MFTAFSVSYWDMLLSFHIKVFFFYLRGFKEPWQEQGTKYGSMKRIERQQSFLCTHYIVSSSLVAKTFQ
jgi:hypothetical protein